MNNNPIYFLQDIVRRGARLVGWEIGEAIEGVMWTIGIGCFVLRRICLRSCGFSNIVSSLVQNLYGMPLIHNGIFI